MNNIPLIEAPQQEQPTFPLKRIEVTPQGWIVTIFFAPDITFQTTIARPDVQNLIKFHQNMLQKEQMEQRVIQKVMREKQ